MTVPFHVAGTLFVDPVLHGGLVVNDLGILEPQADLLFSVLYGVGSVADVSPHLCTTTHRVNGGGIHTSFSYILYAVAYPYHRERLRSTR